MYTNANSRIYLDQASAYNPSRTNAPGGRQFSSAVKPVLTNRRTASSFEEALHMNSSRFRDPKDGQVKYITIKEIGGDTYEFGISNTRTSTGRGKLAINASAAEPTSRKRRNSARASTADGTDLNMSANKYQDINDKQKQAHHIVEIAPHAPAFEGRSPESKAYIIGELNKHGFYPGDDRRNYSALRGNLIFSNTGERIYMMHLDEHQGGVHGANSLSTQVQKRLPTAEQFKTMTDDQVVTALLPSAYAGRIDVQRQKKVSKRAQAKQLAKFYQADKAAKAQAKTLPATGELPM